MLNWGSDFTGGRRISLSKLTCVLLTPPRSESARQHSEEIRMEAMRLMDQKEIKTDTSQVDSTSRFLYVLHNMDAVN